MVDMPEQRSDSPLLALMLNLALIAGIAAVVNLGMMQWLPPFLQKESSLQPVIAVIDAQSLSEQVIRALTWKVYNGEMTADEMSHQSKAFSETLLKEFEHYEQQGVMILRNDAIYSRPDYVIDLTDTVKMKLHQFGFEFKENAP